MTRDSCLVHSGRHTCHGENLLKELCIYHPRLLEQEDFFLLYFGVDDNYRQRTSGCICASHYDDIHERAW